MPEILQNEQTKLEDRVGSRSLYIEMREKKGGFMPYFHYHTSYELFYIKNGTATFIIGNKNFSVHEGTLLVIPPTFRTKAFMQTPVKSPALSCS